MKTPVCLPTCVTVAVLVLCACLAHPGCHAEYEIFTQRYTADPSPYVADGRMYITTTHDLANDTGWHMRDYNCLSSDDLVNWRDEGIVFSIDSVTWAHSAWAQQVVQAPNGTFLMAYPGMGGSFNWSYPGGVGIASSHSPAGPFVDQLGGALMPGDDPTLFVDKRTGDVHLCSNLNGPNCGVLGSDYKSWKHAPPNLQHWPAGSQSIPGSDFTKAGWHWYEAPWIHQIGDTFYLSFMMNQQCPGANTSIGGTGCPTGFCATPTCTWAHYGSDIGYATSTVSAVANYTWQGSLMWSPPFNCGLAGLGNESSALCNATGGDNSHHGMVEFPQGSGRHYLAYHTRKLGAERHEYRGYQRNIALDRFYVNTSDARKALLPITATPSWLRPAKYLNPYAQTPAFTMAGASPGVHTEPCRDAASTHGAKHFNVAGLLVNGFVHVRHADFGSGSGATSVQLRVATKKGVAVEVRSSPRVTRAPHADAKLIVACDVPATGGWENWKTVTCPIPAGRASGVHAAVYFVFRLPTGGGTPNGNILNGNRLNGNRPNGNRLNGNRPNGNRLNGSRLNGSRLLTGNGGGGGSGGNIGLARFNFWQFRGGKVTGAVPPPVTVQVAIRARGTGQYVVARAGVPASANATTAGTAGSFVLVDNEDGSWGIMASAGGLLCAQDSGELLASRPEPRLPSGRGVAVAECTQFRLQPTVDGSWAMQSYHTRGWVKADGADGLLHALGHDPRILAHDAGRFELIRQ